MILTLCAATVLACSGGGAKGGSVPASGTYSATRFIPGNASYAIASRTVREGQQALRDLIETFGILADVHVDEVSRELAAVLFVDPLSSDAVANVGIDLDGGVALFSEHFNPTLVVRLASPQAFRAFIDRQQELKIQSVVDGGVEVFTAPLFGGKVKISWAVADSWLWVHLGLPNVADDSVTWFAASRRPSAPTWAAELQGANTPVAGFIDAGRFLADLESQVRGSDEIACLRSLPRIGRVRVALAGDATQASARLSVDLGAAAARIEVKPVPAGFAAATAQAPFAAQLNLSMGYVRANHLACLRSAHVVDHLDEVGILAGRGYVRSFDPDNRDGTGAISLDLAHPRFFQSKLEQIPMRGAFERSHTFEGQKGKTLSVPMFPRVDYVLTNEVALAGIGDGQLATMLGKGAAVPGPLFELAVQPQAMSIDSWTALFELLDVGGAKRVAERLQRWRQARVNLTMEGSRLVLLVNGTRR